MHNIAMLDMSILRQIPTAVLVEELQTREKSVFVPPHEPFQLTVGQNSHHDHGPVTILIIND